MLGFRENINRHVHDLQSKQLKTINLTIGCRLTVSQLPLKQWYEGSTSSARAEWTNQYSGVATVGRQSLALNQKLAGSIPVSGTVAVLYWFRNLAVNQVYVGSIPIGHPLPGFRLQVSDFSFMLKPET